MTVQTVSGAGATSLGADVQEIARILVNMLSQTNRVRLLQELAETISDVEEAVESVRSEVEELESGGRPKLSKSAVVHDELDEPSISYERTYELAKRAGIKLDFPL